jgi:phenylalanine ammonia-lyase
MDMAVVQEQRCKKPISESLDTDFEAVKDMLCNWIKEIIHTKTNISLDKIDTYKPIIQYGLDSITEAEVVVELNDWLKTDFPVHILYQYASIIELSEYLAKQHLEHGSSSILLGNSTAEVKVGGTLLSLNDIIRVACAKVKVKVEEKVRNKVDSAAEYIRQAVSNDKIIYGVTTNFGGMAKENVGASNVNQLQRTLILGLKCSIGNKLAVQHVRAAMLIILNSLLKGISGIRFELAKRIADFLNAELTPVVHDLGSIGASGDLVPMSYIAGCITGMSEKYKVASSDNQEIDALTALRKLGLKAIVLQAKEGLALVNSTAMMTGIACNSIEKFTQLVNLSLFVHAYFMEALQADLQSLDKFVHENKPHRGQMLVAQKMRLLLENAKFTNENQKMQGHLVQDRYSIRCVAQYLGVIFDSLDTIRSQVEIEANSVTDNPLVDIQNQRCVHSGNFLGQYISHSMDQLRYNLSLLVKHIDVQIALLVSPEFNGGLPASLGAWDEKSVKFGLKGLQICANSIMPIIVHQANPIATLFPTHAEQFNQNINSQGFASANLSWQSLDAAQWYFAIAIIFAIQSIELRCYKLYGHYHAHAYLAKPLVDFYELIYQIVGEKMSLEKAFVHDNSEQFLDDYLKKIYDDLVHSDGKISKVVNI